MILIDLVLILVLLGTIALGFFKGTIKLLVSLFAFYASVVLAGLYFRFMATFFTSRGTAPQVANAISFFLILFACFVLLALAGLYTFRYIRLPGRLDYLDRILGTVLGVGLAVLLTGILAMLLNYVFVENTSAQANSLPIMGFLQRSVRGSTVCSLLINRILPTVYTLVGPFLPEAALTMFNPVQ